MAEVYKIMQVSNKTSGYRAGDRVYVGYYTAGGEFREAKTKTNQRTGQAVRTSGIKTAIKNAGNLERRSESKRNRNARTQIQRNYR